jgi:hypothetical protein
MLKTKKTGRLANSDGHCSHYYSWEFDGIDAGDFATVYAANYRTDQIALGHFGSIGYFTWKAA